MESIIVAVLGLIVGSLGGYFYKKNQIKGKSKNLVEKSQQVLADAKAKAKEIVYEAKSEVIKLQDDLKKEERQKQSEFHKTEERLMKKESQIDEKNERLDKMRDQLELESDKVKKLKDSVEQMHRKQEQELEKVAGLSREDAKGLLLEKVEEQAKEDLADHIKKIESDLKSQAEEKAKWILADAISRCAAETTSESTVTTINLPSDDMKGRIIGREGRNINALEQITGVDVIIDDTPGSIVISCFDLVRRYVAKVVIERLLEDGRIHPARIEEMFDKVRGEVGQLIKELGDKAVLETGVTGLHPNLVKILGRLKFRVSHGQNALKRSMEVSFLAGMLAAELGADENVCRRAGLLHNVGKAVDHEVPGHHAKIGGDIARKFGLNSGVVEAIESQAVDAKPETLEGQVLAAAILIAESRPGASKDNLDNYIKRLSELESACNDFDGVDKSYVLQAGREVRVFLDAERVDDYKAVQLAHKIVKKIEIDMQHPGPVKVNLIREKRAEAFAT
jgi:ribonuclease Y